MSEKNRLLIVEDEEAILQGLCDLFEFNGYEVDSRMDGRDGLRAALSGNYDCIILDVMLPSLDGFSICEEIRKHSREQPIVMLTAKNTEDDIINGLSLGADDYIAKPFSVKELVLRIEVLMRRSGRDKQQSSLSIDSGLVIDTDNLTAVCDGAELLLTRREVSVLDFLFRYKQRPVSRRELLAEVWGYNKASDVDTRTVDIHIAKLRKKIEADPKKPKRLHTLRGEGYKLTPLEG